MASLLDDLSAGQYQKVARGLLGPAYERLAALPGLLGEFSPGADVRDYQNYASSALQKALSGDYGQAGLDALWSAAALAGVALPGSVSGYRKLADKLPMDEASRMARAKEMEFDEQEFYHLTDQDFDEFIPGGPRGIEDQGAVFVRPDPSRQMSGHNVVFADEGAREIPVRIRRQATLYIDEYNRKEMIDRFKLNSEFPWIVKTEEARRLRDIGFDNIELEFAGHVNEIAVLDPKNIRSRFARFDPAKRGSADLGAGIAGLGLLAPAGAYGISGLLQTDGGT